MIGKLTGVAGYPDAHLHDDGLWWSEDGNWAAYLNLTYNPRDSQGASAILPFGYGALFEAAAALGGQAEPENPLPPLPDGAVS